MIGIETMFGGASMGQRMRGVGSAVAVILAAGGSAACSLDSLLKNDEIPPGTTDPALTKTPAGALAAYTGMLAQFQWTFNSSVASSGLLTDELMTGHLLGEQGANIVDLRDLPETKGLNGGGGQHWDLQQVRGQAGQAIGLLTTYAPEQRAVIGNTYAIEAYAEVFLAELYCSGIPLSTLDFDGDYTYQPGSTTAQVLTHAIALFDTSLTFAGDTARFVQLATMGKARAQLGLGDFAGAAATVASVPTNFVYQFAFSATSLTNFNVMSNGMNYGVPDREGTNGLDFISSGDPRSAATQVETTLGGIPVFAPNKYNLDGSSPLVLASGIEARLIEAEAALHAGDATQWLSMLNALRSGGGPMTLTVPDTLVDTLGFTGCSMAQPCDNDGYSSSIDYSGLVLVETYTTSIPEGPEAQACRDRAPNRTYGCVSPPVNVYADPAHTHTVTVVPSGTGGVAGLDVLPDPGAALGEPAATAARVDLMFRERAMWLYLTGHRLGDLRRLIRQYGRRQDQVFPVGSYPATRGFLYQYGHDVNFPPPSDEAVSNPLYSGCFNRDA